jgi:hypothetical protein
MIFAKPPPPMQPGGGGAAKPAPDPYADYWAAAGRERGDIQALSQAEQKVNEDAGVAAGLQGQQYGKDAQDMLDRAHEQNEKAAALEKQIDQASLEARDTKIDPERYWNSRNAFQKGAFMVANALGSFVEGYTNGAVKNPTVAKLNAAVDRDIDAQKEAIQQKRGRVADMRGALADMYRRFGNMDQAEAGARILLHQQLDAQAKEYAAASGNAVVQANADWLSDHLQAEIAKEKASIIAHQQQGAPALNVKGLVEYGERLQKEDIPEAESQLGKLENIASQKDPAGFGFGARVAHYLGADFAMSQEGRNNRAAMDQAILSLAHATGRVTPAEVDAVRDAYIGAMGNPEAMRNFVASMRQQIEAKARNINASTDPRVIQQYQALGGADVQAGATAPPPAPGTFRSPGGQ